MTLPVVVSHGPMPEQTRQRFDLVATLTVEDIVAQVLPDLPQDRRQAVRVVLIHGDEQAVVPQENWARVRPHPGVTVCIHVVPGDVISLAISAASWLTHGAGLTFGAMGAFATNAVFFGSLAAIGYLGYRLATSLIPSMDRPDQKRGEDNHAITGWQNQARLGEVVPDLRGRLRMAPIFAARPFTEIVEGKQYIRSLFCFGFGPVKIEDIRIGDTSISEFDNVEMEIREGRPDDDPITLYNFQVIEEAVSVDLVRPRQKDALGNELEDAPHVETPEIRKTASNAAKASVIISFPAGLYRINDEGKLRNQRVHIRIRQRQEGGDWQEVETLEIVERIDSPHFVQFTWSLPERGVWEVELTRMTNTTYDANKVTRCTWVALQAFRPELPINFDQPLALAAVRIRASHQLNNNLDTFNALASRYELDWQDNAWVEATPRNPAAHFVGVLMSKANARPAALEGIDLDTIQDWYQHCKDKGLHYDRLHQEGESLAEVLRAICAAGRASPRRDGRKWSVVIDRPQEFPVAHITPRNSRQFRAQRSYFTPPDAVRIRFQDETNDYEQGEKLVPWIGHTGPIDLTEEIQMPGKTNPGEIEIEAVRRMYEIELRPNRYTVIQDGILRTATRGDLVHLSHYVMNDEHVSARVTRVEDDLVELDEVLTTAQGQNYALQYRDKAAHDGLGETLVAAVEPAASETRLLRVMQQQVMPDVGDIVSFGRPDEISIPVRVHAIEPAENMSVMMTFVDDAAELDALAEAHEVSDWTPIIGEPSPAFGPPGTPEFRGVSIEDAEFLLSGYNGSQAGSGQRAVLVGAGVSGPTAVFINRIQVEHRLAGETEWVSGAILGSSGYLALEYADGSMIELQLTAFNLDDVPSETGPLLTYTVDYELSPLPAALDEASIQVTGGLGHTAITFTPTDVQTASVAIYRVPEGEVLDQEAHELTVVAVQPGLGVALVDGDATRANLLSDPGFDSGSNWTASGGWAIAGSAATHTPGAASDLSQTVALTDGQTYRIFAEIAGYSAGNVTLGLTGGTDQTGVALSADGLISQSLTATGGNTAVTFAADASFDAALLQAGLYLQTPACAPAGRFAYVFIPRNADDVAGPATGSFETIII